MPRVDESIDALSGSKFFCTLDMASGYWQVAMNESDKSKTAFATHKGLYQFKVMPFGLTNSPATFERLMEVVLQNLQWERCLVYLDDVIVFGKTFDETLSNLITVFDRFREANLKLKPKKCKLFRNEVSFLGHIVSKDGVKCDPEKIRSVQDWKIPENVTEVKSFLGLASYYRKFIPDFAILKSQRAWSLGRFPLLILTTLKYSIERVPCMLMQTLCHESPGVGVVEKNASVQSPV